MGCAQPIPQMCTNAKHANPYLHRKTPFSNVLKPILGQKYCNIATCLLFSFLYGINVIWIWLRTATLCWVPFFVFYYPSGRNWRVIAYVLSRAFGEVGNVSYLKNIIWMWCRVATFCWVPKIGNFYPSGRNWRIVAYINITCFCVLWLTNSNINKSAYNNTYAN